MNTLISSFREILRSRFLQRGIVFLILCGFFFLPWQNLYAQTPQNKFLVLAIDDKIINPITADYVSGGIDKAQDNHYAGVILMLDTPGGLLESTRVIVKKIMNAKVPVIVYISPSGARAGSAGVFITMAAPIAAMAPSTNIGAAHPVSLSEQPKNSRSLTKAIEELTQTLQKQSLKPSSTPKTNALSAKKEENPSESVLEDKIMNDTLAWIKALARYRNRNADWAMEAVAKSSSLTEKEALEKHVINLIATDINDLLKKIDGVPISLSDKTVILKTQNAELIAMSLTARQNILSTLINPNIAYILMLLGFLCLFVEITHPGVIVPGVVGAISLIIAFYAFAMLPVNFAGFLLIGLALILFMAEAFTFHTFGFLILAGAFSMLIGSLMLINSPLSFMRVSLNIILSFVVAVAAIVVFLATNVLRVHKKKTSTGPDALVGQIGIAQNDIHQEGQAFVMGEIWTAINQTKIPIKKGEKIKVLGVDKVKLLVSKYDT